MAADCSVSLAGTQLRNPIVLAAGTCGYGVEFAGVLDPADVGAITTKSITREPREGNRPWRIVDTPRGMLNAIGLANVGLDVFVNEKLPAAGRLDAPIIASIAGHSIDDYVTVAQAFDGCDEIALVELNVSCPNTADGQQFGEHRDALASLLREIRPVLSNKKLFVKLSPNASDVCGMAGAAVESGADGLTLMNTFTAMSIDVATRKPRLERGMGGLSGVGIHPIVVRMVHQIYCDVARDANVPIIGLGGVLDWQDAAEFILAGATAVGIGTSLFVDPTVPKTIANDLARWVDQQGCSKLAELVGAVRT